MDFQRYYDVAYVKQETHEERPDQVVKHFFMRTGKRETLESIERAYGEIKEIALSFGYSDPLQYLIDEYSERIREKIVVFNRTLDMEKIRAFLEGRSSDGHKSELPSEWSIPDVGSSNTPTAEIEEPGRISNKSKIKRPAKRRIQSPEESDGDSVPEKIKARINKSRRKSRLYKEMDPGEREIENNFDVQMYSSQHESRANLSSENTPENSPFSVSPLGALDVEFRKIMQKLCNKDRLKEKSDSRQEMILLKEYFQKKLNIEEKEEISGKKLAVAIAGIMKKLQDRIFSCEDKNALKLLVSIKNKLCNYYNFNKK